MNDYGRANRFQFDDPNKWHTVESVPLLDEHTMTDDNGNPIADVDRQALEEIAHNNNKKVYETGDPATLILGHTSDDPRAPEKPAQGFVVNYKVKPFKRNADGQVVYAIHGDYKLRPNKAHLVDDYPRRSVELWWHKKDIDPIAMLGGSSPERELGAVIRHSRFNHISMNVGATAGYSVSNNGTDNTYQEGQVIQFSRRGSYTIETYTIEDHTPTHKYAKRRLTYKESRMPNNNGRNGRPRMYGAMNGQIPAERRPSKYAGDQFEIPAAPSAPVRPNPKRRNEVQEMGDEGPDEMNEDNFGDDSGPEQYDGMSMGGGGTQDYDGGDESIPGEDGDMGEGDGESDPVLAKVFQSKQWNELSSGIGQIKEMLQGMMGGGGQPGMDDGMGGPSGDPGMQGDEMPAPGGPPGMGGQAPPPGAEAMGDDSEQYPSLDNGEGEEPEEDQRSMRGQKPVKMGAAEGMSHSTGMPGPTSGYIPGLSKTKGKAVHSKMSRGTNMPSPRPTQNRPRNQEDKRDRIIRDLRIQLSRAKAQQDIQQLESEGVMFGPTPEVAEKIKYSRQEELTLAYLHDEDSADEGGEPDTYVKDKIEEMRVCYSRRRPDPVRRNTPNQASIARYSRTEADVTGQPPTEQNDDDFENQLGTVGDFQAISDFADLQTVKKMSRPEAIKFMRKKYGMR